MSLDKHTQEDITTKYPITLIRDTRETTESGPLCITDLFKNKSVAYFLLITKKNKNKK